MATKKPTKRTRTTKAASADVGAKITRITASDDKKSDTKKKAASVAEKRAKSATRSVTADKSTSDTVKSDKPRRRTPWRAITEYVKGSWYELQQVRWPDRQLTWNMTGALIGFTLFFVVVISLLDAFFQYLFNQLVK